MIKRTEVKALCFDVFGSVVDWRSSLIDDLSVYANNNSLPLDVSRLVDDWRAGYQPSMQRVRSGELPWKTLDELHRATLERLLAEQDITGLGEALLDHMNKGWHRLKPWRDSVTGLTALREAGFEIAPLSNGNRTLLSDIAEHAGLPWTRILSAEDTHHYKPDPQVYLSAATAFGCKPEEIMMCAAHNYDLAAAQRLGFKTAFWPRPTEYGLRQTKDFAPTGDWDIIATDIVDFAQQMVDNTGGEKTDERTSSKRSEQTDRSYRGTSPRY